MHKEELLIDVVWALRFLNSSLGANHVTLKY